VDVVYPDGDSRRFSLDDKGRLTLPTLPRGNYTVTAVGPGPVMTRPLALSRDQEVDLTFYSWLDIGAVVAVLLVAVLGFPLLGRRRRRAGRAARQATVTASDAVPDESGETPSRPAITPHPVRP
jgi:hypothetical protein